jgi:hypothetical protein
MGFLIFSNSTSKQDSITYEIAKPDDSLNNTTLIYPNTTRPKSIGGKSVSFENESLSVKTNHSLIIKEKSYPLNNQLISSDTTDSKIVVPDSVAKIEEPHVLFSFSINSDSFNYNYKEVFLEKGSKTNTLKKELIYHPHQYHRSHLNWTLALGLISISILLAIKTYYQKNLNQVINTLFNFQLAEKMFQEKNILVRRAFFLLNLNFVIIISLFFLLLTTIFGYSFTSKNYLDYLIIFSLVVLGLLVRYAIFYLTGILFAQLPVVLEYLHHKYLYNKNIGLALIPIIYTSIYISPSLSKLLLISSLIIIVFITIIKLIRGFQIILKNGVLLFYTILYLCTLELLPLVLGSKIINSLR